MKLHYYPETDSLYIEFSEEPGLARHSVALSTASRPGSSAASISLRPPLCSPAMSTMVVIMSCVVDRVPARVGLRGHRDGGLDAFMVERDRTFSGSSPLANQLHNDTVDNETVVYSQACSGATRLGCGPVAAVIWSSSPSAPCTWRLML